MGLLPRLGYMLEGDFYGLVRVALRIEGRLDLLLEPLYHRRLSISNTFSLNYTHL